MPVLGNEHIKESLRQSKEDKQRNEIARLTKLTEQLIADKRNILFELHKERKANEQLRERINAFPIGGAK